MPGAQAREGTEVEGTRTGGIPRAGKENLKSFNDLKSGKMFYSICICMTLCCLVTERQMRGEEVKLRRKRPGGLRRWSATIVTSLGTSHGGVQIRRRRGLVMRRRETRRL